MMDLKFAFRQLIKNPGFTATAVFTLALCIGANLVIFAVVDGVLLRPLPFPEPERLVRIYHEYPKSDLGRTDVSATDLYHRRDKIEAFASIGTFKTDAVIVGEAGAGSREEILRVSSDFFETLDLQPSVGRAFTEDEMTYQTHHLAILSDSYWRRHFNADPNVLGSRVRVNGFDKTIVGVLPAGFRFLSTRPQILLPLSSPQDLRTIEALHSNADWGMIARLKPGATVSEAQSQLTALDTVIQPQFRWAKTVSETGYRAMIAPLHQDHVAGIRPTLLLLQAGGFFLLVIGAVNLVNLLLVRASARVKELAVRQSLGAGRIHVVRQTTTETLLLASLGGLAGLAVGAIGVKLLTVFGVDRLPLGSQVAFDGRVAATAVAGTILLGLLIGLPLAWFHLRGRLVEVLQSETRSGTAGLGVQRLRHGFVAAQLALAFVLLAGAGLLSASLKRTMEISPGFRTEHLLSGHISLIHKDYFENDVRLRFADRVVEQISGLPGVQFAGLVSSIPVAGKTGHYNMRVVSVENRPGDREDLPLSPFVYGVAGNYFRAMGIPLRAGRFLNDMETRSEDRVCVVDETFARQNWPNEDAVGQLVYDGPDIEPDEQPYKVIGVVGSVKQTELTERSESGAVYFHLRDLPTGFDGLYLAARTLQQPESFAPVLEKSIRDIEPELPLNEVRTMETRIADTLIERRSPAVLAGVFAGVALLLAMIGTYGVLSFAVAQRRREIGLRMALGALPRQIGRQFLSLGLRLFLLGMVLGIPSAWAAGRAMQGILFDVPPLHAATLGGTVFILAFVALIACLLPALRASRLDPMEALREE